MTRETNIMISHIHSTEKHATNIHLLLSIIIAIIAIALITWLLFKPANSAYAAMEKGQYRVASKFYEQEIRQGSEQAIVYLANLKYLGLGIPKDQKAAAKLYFTAAKQGNGTAQLNLGHLYKQGLGVKKDPVRAFAWYKMAHGSGNQWAENYLTQVSLDFSITPLQISTVRETWPTLEALAKEEL